MMTLMVFRRRHQEQRSAAPGFLGRQFAAIAVISRECSGDDAAGATDHDPRSGTSAIVRVRRRRLAPPPIIAGEAWHRSRQNHGASKRCRYKFLHFHGYSSSLKSPARVSGTGLRLQLLAKEEWIAAHADYMRDRKIGRAYRGQRGKKFYCGEFAGTQHRQPQHNEPD